MPSKKDIRDLAAGAGKTTVFDRLVAGTADAVSILVPLFGPVVASIIRQVAPNDAMTYLQEFAAEAGARIELLEADKVDRAYFDSPEWASDAGQVAEAVMQQRNRAKRQHYLAALVNAAVVDRPGDVERQRFLDLLDRIRLSHLRLLAAIVTAQSGTGGGSFDDWIRRRLPDQDVENVRLDWLDLQQAGFLAGIPSGMATTSLESRIESAMPAIGRRFVAFVEAEPEAGAGAEE